MYKKSFRRQVTSSFSKPAFVGLALSVSMAFSCTVARKYQEGKPFVYEVHVKVDGNQKTSEKQDLELHLNNQLDDSLRPQVVSYAGIYKRIVAPPVFDSANVRRSVGFMVTLLNSLGYFAPAIKDSFHIRNVHGHHFLLWGKFKESRTSVYFRVNPGKQLKFDSIAYDLQDSALQGLALHSRSQSLLQKNGPYSKAVISSELDRLVGIF
jgi:hypothetical protein